MLYLWDDFAILSKTTHFTFFDDIFSYNIIDCRKHGFKYMPVFVQETGIDYSKYEKEYDIAIIGSAHEERVRFAKRLYKKYKDKYSFKIYFLWKEGKKNDFFCEKEKLSYEEYMILLAKSRVVVDFPLKKQKGPTTRVFEAKTTHTKVLTTLKKIKLYDIYDNNIIVVWKGLPLVPDWFLSNEFSNENNIGVYTINRWLKTLIQ